MKIITQGNKGNNKSKNNNNLNYKNDNNKYDYNNNNNNNNESKDNGHQTDCDEKRVVDVLTDQTRLLNQNGPQRIVFIVHAADDTLKQRTQ